MTNRDPNGDDPLGGLALGVILALIVLAGLWITASATLNHVETITIQPNP